MEEKILVSVVIPIYNAGKYLRECIDSIIDQTYKKNEILLINDGSTDNSEEICKEYSAKYDFIKLFSQKNSGVSVARNLGIEKSNGEYIMFVDPDDYLDPDIITFLLDKADKETDIIACCCNGFNENESIKNEFYETDKVFSTDEDKKDLYLQLIYRNYGQSKRNKVNYTGIGVPWGKLYSRHFLIENGLVFNPLLRRMQDNDFNMYAFAKARKIRYYNKPLYNYRVEHILSFKKKYNPGLIQNYSLICDNRYQFYKNNNLLNGQIRDYFFNECIHMLVVLSLQSIFKPGNKVTFSQKCNQLNQLCEKDVFSIAIKNANSNKLRPKNRVFRWFLSKKMYWFIGLACESFNLVK